MLWHPAGEEERDMEADACFEKPIYECKVDPPVALSPTKIKRYAYDEWGQ